MSRRLAFTPSDPLVSRQWYLTQSRFYEPWLTLPALERVPVAVIDSGVDATHPELAGKILDARSFVGGSAGVDTLGHGTFVAGLIAAGVDNGIGIAGLAPSAELLVAKVVTASRAIPIEAEAKAIRWAVENGARVINMSLGGIRDPLDPDRDSFSRLEADAVAYAVSNGVVVVAAVGNADHAPSSPWPYASYPAALPHVLGVSASRETGGVPKFSNRDKVYNDLAAPGERILSIFPRPLTARFPACSEQGYSSCGPEEYREAQGTSFAAPQVSAAAALLLGLRPLLRPEQVTAILQRTAVDVVPATGCAACLPGRDEHSGWGRLDVAAAIAALDRAAAAGRPLRGERRRGLARVQAVGIEPPHQRRGRLLGRPGRRLRDQAAEGPARVCRADGRRGRALTSASRSGSRRRARSGTSATSASAPASPHVPRPASTSRIGRPRRGRTTCRCGCRAPASRATA